MGDHEKFKNAAAGIQSLVVSVAVLVGGGWTAYTFGFLQDTVSLDLRIEAEQFGRGPDQDTSLLVKVVAKNNGTRYVELDLSQQPLIVQKVVAHESGKLLATSKWTPMYYSELLDNPGTFAIYRTQGVEPGATKVISSLQRLDGPGIYFMRFQVPVSRYHLGKINDPGVNNPDIAARLGTTLGEDAWVASAYFEVVPREQIAAQQAVRSDGGYAACPPN